MVDDPTESKDCGHDESTWRTTNAEVVRGTVAVTDTAIAPREPKPQRVESGIPFICANGNAMFYNASEENEWRVA